MARVKANVSFAGLATMAAGDVRNIRDAKVVKSLVEAGYVTEIKKAASEKVDADEG